MIGQASIAFVSMVALDYVWGAYTKFLIEKRAALAGLFASAIILTNAIVTIAYVNDPLLIPVVMAGAFVGTYLAARFPLK